MEQLDQLLQLNLELEGLLRVAKDRLAKSIRDVEIDNAVIHKFNELYSAFASAYSSEWHGETQQEEEETWTNHEEAEDDESCTIIEEIEEEVSEEDEKPEPPHHSDKATEEREKEAVMPPQFHPENKNEDSPATRPYVAPQMPPVPESADTNTKIMNADKPKVSATVNLNEEEIVPPEYKPAQTENAYDVKDLSKSFTINDKYRFVRDLFNGNRGDFDITLEKIASMSLNEAQMYIIDELGWDIENPTVTEFMVIINNFFNK